jgi:HemX protein
VSLLTNFVLYVFAISLLFSISDLLQRNGNARAIGAGLLGVVWALQAGYFLQQMTIGNGLPVINSFQAIYFFSWVMVTFALVFYFMFRNELILHGLSVVGFIILLLSLHGPDHNPHLHALTADAGIWPLHIALSIGAYALFTISALFAGCYLYLHRRLKTKRFSGFFNRLPDLQWMGRMTYRFALIGWAALTVALLLGCGWLIVIGRVTLLNDLKVYASLLVFVAYGLYLWQGVRLSAVATRLATWNIIVFGLVILNYSAMNLLSGFHKWSWL